MIIRRMRFSVKIGLIFQNLPFPSAVSQRIYFEAYDSYSDSTFQNEMSATGS